MIAKLYGAIQMEFWSALAGIVVIALAFLWFRRSGGHQEGMLAARASGNLYDLGLDVKALPQEAQEKFFIETKALSNATKGKFDSKRFAMRFFGWYCTESRAFDGQGLLWEGAMSDAVTTMREWAKADPNLRQAAESEADRIIRRLYEASEALGLEDEDRLNAQVSLLELATEGDKPIFQERSGGEGDPLAQALQDHKMMVRQHNIYDSLAGSGRSLSWCCALSLYAAMRTAARRDQFKMAGVSWNSIVHRVTLDMMEDNGAPMDDDEFNELEREAYDDVARIDRFVDESNGADASKTIQFLANMFGCAFKPAELRALGKIFSKNVVMSREKMLPHFKHVFE